jgi:hypothetical protein
MVPKLDRAELRRKVKVLVGKRLLVSNHLRDAVRTLRLERIESACVKANSFQLRDTDAMMMARDLLPPA